MRPRSGPTQLQRPDFLQNALKLGLGGKAHGSISVQEGQPIKSNFSSNSLPSGYGDSEAGWKTRDVLLAELNRLTLQEMVDSRDVKRRETIRHLRWPAAFAFFPAA